jgi:hypothetical protein
MHMLLSPVAAWWSCQATASQSDWFCVPYQLGVHFSVQEVPAVHWVQLLEVCVKAEGLNRDLQG